MQAGVLSYWLCDLDRRCDACPLDAALRHVSGPAAPLRTEAEVPAVLPALGPPEAPARAGADLEALLALEVPPPDPGLRYHPAHTWARLEGPARVRVGLDHFATRIVGPLRSVILPHPGTRVRRGHPCAWLDQEGGTLTVLAPVSGTILGCNPQATANPEIVSRDPQGQGWLIELQPSDLDADLNRLQDARLTRLRTAQEIDRWARRVRRELRHRADAEVGATLADGGVRITDVGQLIGPRRRHAIAVEFLSPAGARK
jgi:glycine cleavage system H lipoate-binding protein